MNNLSTVIIIVYSPTIYFEGDIKISSKSFDSSSKLRIPSNRFRQWRKDVCDRVFNHSEFMLFR